MGKKRIYNNFALVNSKLMTVVLLLISMLVAVMLGLSAQTRSFDTVVAQQVSDLVAPLGVELPLSVALWGAVTVGGLALFGVLCVLRFVLTSRVTQDASRLTTGVGGWFYSLLTGMAFSRMGLPLVMLLLIENGTKFDYVSFLNAEISPGLNVLFGLVIFGVLIPLVIDGYKGCGGLVSGFYVAFCCAIVFAVQSYDIINHYVDLPRYVELAGNVLQMPWWLAAEIFMLGFIVFGSWSPRWRRKRAGLTTSDIVHTDVDDIVEGESHDDDDDE